MARLVSYKVKDESYYSTFEDNGKSDVVENKNDDNIKHPLLQLLCCSCCRKTTDEDDIEFALIKYAEVYFYSFFKNCLLLKNKNCILGIKIINTTTKKEHNNTVKRHTRI